MMSQSSNSEWRKLPIREVYNGLYDGPHATPSTASEGPIFLGIKNITEDGMLDLSDIRHISDEEYPEWTRRVTPRPGDIVFTYEATLHRYAIIPEGFRGCLGRRVALIRPNTEKVDAQFLLYYFFGKEWHDTVKKHTLHGSTVDRIPLSDFPEFQISLPPLLTQRKIAAVLSAYDDLIENNTRRIAILEEMAQAIYREWFVHFRFPGHEDVDFVETELGEVPAGWEVVPFTEIADVLSGGTPRTKVDEYWNGDIPFFSPKDISGASSFYVISTDRQITQLGVENCSSDLYPKDTVFITARGTVGKTVLPAVPMAMNQSCYALRGRDEINERFVFLSIRTYVEELQQKAHGAVFDTIIMDTFRQLKTTRPPLPLIHRFTDTVDPLFDQILNLLQKNENLRRTRDLLLPRLVSGALDISDVDSSRS